MESTQVRKGRGSLLRKVGRDESGIALFIVITFVTILSILMTEFVYVAQVNQRMAYDGLDQLRAHYLAKSAFKLSLLRLKAYSQVKALVGGGEKKDGTSGGGGGIPGVPKALIEKIWSFPFFYPFPTNVPGMSTDDKDKIKAFQNSSALEGRYSAVIESESGKYNLNSIIAGFVPEAPTPTPSGSPTPTPTPTISSGTQGVTGPSGFDSQAARDGLKDYLAEIWTSKIQADEDFAQEYRDFRLDDLLDSIYAWADRTYEPRTDQSRHLVKPKKAPFYSLQELHMVNGMEDKLFDVFAPSLTVNPTPGLNINTMKEDTLRAITENKLSKEETEEFFKFRDSEEEDHLFKGEDDFFKYLQDQTAAFKGDEKGISQLREKLKARNIRLVPDETIFKITVQATVNQSARMIEAWVTLNIKPKAEKDSGTSAVKPNPAGANIVGGGQPEKPDSGLKITFMRIL